MAPTQLTKGEADYLVAEHKFITAIPQPKLIDGKEYQIRVPVFRSGDPSTPIRRLYVMATVRKAPPGVLKANPSAALEWYSKRIRGLNFEIWHDNPYGTDPSKVEGRHEHIWFPEHEDSYVIAAHPTVTRKQLLDVLQWGLDKWNIEVRQRQVGVPYGKDRRSS